MSISLLGLIILGITAYGSIENLSARYNIANSTRDAVESVLDVKLKVIDLKNRGNEITGDLTDSYRALIADLQGRISGELQRVSENTTYDELHEIFVRLNAKLHKHSKDLERWLNIKSEKGFDPNTGVLQELNSLNNKLLQSIGGFAVLTNQLQEIKALENSYIISSSENSIKNILSSIEKLKKTSQHMGYPQLIPDIDLYGQKIKRLKALSDELYQVQVEIEVNIESISGIAEEAKELLHTEIIPQVFQAVDDTREGSISILIASFVAIILILSTLLTWITRSISKGIHDFTDFLEHIAKGELSYRMEGYDSVTDEFGNLANTANLTAENLCSLITQNKDICEKLAQMSKEQSKAISVLDGVNKRVSEKATQVATATEELHVTIKNINESTTDLHEAARNTGKAGTTSVEAMLRTDDMIKLIMKRVSNAGTVISSLCESTNRVGSVVEVIDSLAGQTNLLALNAAIEAARAGEQGRGFAVVADEVRNLASKTTEATARITDIVNTIQEESQSAVEAMEKGQAVAQKGVQLGEDAKNTIGLIEKQTSLTSDLSGQMAIAIEEMKSTIGEISASIESVAVEIQRNTDAVTEIAGTAADVSSQASSLQNHTQRFSV